MNKKIFKVLLTTLLLTGCGNTTESSSSTPLPSNSESIFDSDSTTTNAPEIEYYATVNSQYDTIHLYGVLNEVFDLNTINYSRCSSTKPTYKSNDETAIKIEEDTLTFLKKGIYEVGAYNGNKKIYSLQIIVNEDEESRYKYPLDIELEDYNLHAGKNSYVTITGENSLILESDETPWNRISYDLLPKLSTNYTIECDVSFKSSTNNERWFGLVFRDQSTSKQNYPYYQFDIRRNTSSEKAVEITYVYADGSYSYPYTSKWNNGGFGVLSSNDVVHMKLTLVDNIIYCSLSCNGNVMEFNVNLPNVTAGNFGFQCSGAKVEINNIELSLNSDTIVSSNANKETSKVNIYDDAIDSLKPNIIASGRTTDEIYGVNIDAQQYYAKVKNNILYNINDEQMDVSLNDIFLETRGIYIPNLEINDKNTLKSVYEICKSYGVVDLTIWSANTDILDSARDMMPYARLGYIPTNISSFETFDEIGSICRFAGSHYANLILIDSKLLNKENVNNASGLGYSIVANAKNGENYSVIDGALDGCKLILANYNKDVQKQVNTIYDSAIFNVDERSSLYINQTHSLLSYPYATGHRGSGNTGSNPTTTLPENTIESFKLAYDSGAQAVEIDVHETKDKKLAVIHNSTTEAYCGTLNNYTVKNTTLSVLQTLPLYSGGKLTYDYKIPSYEEVLTAFSSDEYKNKSMVVEIKDNAVSTGKQAIEIAKEYGWYNRIILITFDSNTAKKLREYDPGVQVSYLGTVQRQDNTQYWSSVDSFLSNGVGLASQLSTVSKEAHQEANARGQVNWLWTFNNTDHNSLISHILNGNVGFTTNYVSFFTNNKYKLIAENNVSIKQNETKTLTANSITYNQTIKQENDIEIILLSDNASVSGNSITRTGNGTIYIVLKHKTKWSLASSETSFYIYSDLIEIN